MLAAYVDESGHSKDPKCRSKCKFGRNHRRLQWSADFSPLPCLIDFWRQLETRRTKYCDIIMPKIHIPVGDFGAW